MLQAAVELRTPRGRMLGSAPAALASAARAITALDAHCSATDVALSVVGAPGAFVIPWSQASIAGFSATSVLPQADLARVEARVARLWPPGPETLGVVAARLVEGILERSRRTFTAFAVLDGELGVRRAVAAVPVLVSRTGLSEVRLPPLTGREQVQLESALGRH
jgi:malate/lactate dehydrogenase